MLRSIASSDGGWCVDFFEHPTGGYGFEHFRSDPEDQGAWTVLGGFSRAGHESVGAAATAATEAIPWLGAQPLAKQSLDSWLAEND